MAFGLMWKISKYSLKKLKNFKTILALLPVYAIDDFFDLISMASTIHYNQTFTDYTLQNCSKNPNFHERFGLNLQQINHWQLTDGSLYNKYYNGQPCTHSYWEFDFREIKFDSKCFLRTFIIVNILYNYFL